VEAKDNAKRRARNEKFSNFRPESLVSRFSNLVVVYTTYFLDFSCPHLSPRSADFACTRNEFALGPATGLPSLRNTLSSDISCEKLPQVIRFFVLITLKVRADVRFYF
jgi:hypothetical protein